MTTPKYFKLPEDGLPEKRDTSKHKQYPTRHEMTGQGSDYGFNECRDEVAQKDWYLCEEEIAKIILDFPDDIDESVCCTIKRNKEAVQALSKVLAAAGPRILKPKKENKNGM